MKLLSYRHISFKLAKSRASQLAPPRCSAPLPAAPLNLSCLPCLVATLALFAISDLSIKKVWTE